MNNTIIILFLTITPFLFANWDKNEQVHYALEINEKLVGYAQIEILTEPGVIVQSSVFARLSLVGGLLDYKHSEKVKLNKDNKPYFYNSTSQQGNVSTSSITYITEESARIISQPSSSLKTVSLPKKIFFEVYPYYSFLKNFGDEKSKEYSIFNDLNKSVVRVTYEKIGTEKMFLAKKSYVATKFRRINRTSQEEEYLWVDESDGLVLKSHSRSNVFYLSTPKIVQKVKSIPGVLELVKLKSLEESSLHNQVHKYRYLSNGKDVGTSSFIIQNDDDETYICHTKLDVVDLQTDVQWRVKKDLIPMEYELKGNRGKTTYLLHARFFNDHIVQKIAKNKLKNTNKIKMKNQLYLYGDSDISLTAVLVSCVPLREKAAISLNIFHTNLGKQQVLRIKVLQQEEIPYQNKTKNCWKLQMDTGSSKNLLWLDQSGKLIRKKSENIVIELE